MLAIPCGRDRQYRILLYSAHIAHDLSMTYTHFCTLTLMHMHAHTCVRVFMCVCVYAQVH